MKASRGNVVWINGLQLFGLVTETDEKNLAKGGELNTRIRVFKDGGILTHSWFMDHEFEVVDDGTH